MSPSNNEPKDKSQKPITEPDTELKDEGDPTEAEIVAAFTEETSEKSPEDKPKETKPKKKLAKKTKIIIGVSAWLVLVGAAVALAFILKPAEETEHLAPVVAEFKWVDDQVDKDLDYVDIDYYGFYDANSIYVERVVATDDYNSPYHGIYRIRGLKNKSVEDKINQRIIAIADSLLPLSGEQTYQRPQVNFAANLDNVLSANFYYHPKDDTSIAKRYGITFDLNTGNELSFDDVFIKDYDPTQYLHKAFYDYLSESLQFSRLTYARAVATYERNPNQCPEYYLYAACNSGESIEEVIASARARIAEIDAKLANMEEYSLEEAKKYLAGDKHFYLNAYGPAFITDDDKTVIASEARDNAKYLAFYRDYKSDSSLFENTSIGSKHIFYTRNSIYDPTYLSFSVVTEANNYLLEESKYGKFPEFETKYQEYIRNQLLSLANETGKFYHFSTDAYIYRAGSSGREYSYYIASSAVDAEMCNADYYKSTYRKAIIDGKTQIAVLGPFQPARTGRYDPAEISKIDSNKIKGVNALMDESGKIYTEPSEIFADGVDWEGYLKQFFYDNDTRWENGYVYHNEYSDTDKAHHNFGYRFTGGMIQVGLKDNSSASGFSRSQTVPTYYIPNEYLKEPFKH